MSRPKSICKTCKHKAGCDETVRLYGIPNTRVTECKAYEPKGGDTEFRCRDVDEWAKRKVYGDTE